MKFESRHRSGATCELACDIALNWECQTGNAIRNARRIGETQGDAQARFGPGERKGNASTSLFEVPFRANDTAGLQVKRNTPFLGENWRE